MDLPKEQEVPVWKRRLAKAQTFVVENYLPLAFAVALTFALAYPVPGRFLVRIVVAGNVHIIQEVNMAIVFFISGLVLNTTELRKAMRRDSWPSVAFGFVMILLVTPALGFAMREIPLTPPAFAVGLTIFCLVPTTLGIGVALVRSCKGNEAISLLLTVGTNMLGVFTMPLYLRLLFLNFETGLRLNINIPDLLLKLTLTILVPSILGKALRELSKPVEEFAKKHRTPLSLFSTTNLACIVWQTLSGARDLLFEQRASMIVSVIVLSAAIHVFYLGLNHVLVKYGFATPIQEHVAVVVMASQKSAPVAVTVISYVTSDPAQQGLLAIPSIVGQLSQIFLGAALAKYVAPKVIAALRAADASSRTSGASTTNCKDLPPAPSDPTVLAKAGDTGGDGDAADPAAAMEAGLRRAADSSTSASACRTRSGSDPPVSAAAAAEPADNPGEGCNSSNPAVNGSGLRLQAQHSSRGLPEGQTAGLPKGVGVAGERSGGRGGGGGAGPGYVSGGSSGLATSTAVAAVSAEDTTP